MNTKLTEAQKEQNKQEAQSKILQYIHEYLLENLIGGKTNNANN